MMEFDEDIRQMVYNNLHITYTLDDSTQSRLDNEISEGIAFIRRFCDPSADCSPGTHFGALLCDYVLRAEAGALETFARDFGLELTSARILTDVEDYAAAMGYRDDQT